MKFHRADLLALLEEGPSTVTRLAAWTQQDERLLRHELKRLAGERQVKRIAKDEWALAGYQPRARDDGSQVALAFLTAGPQTSTAIANRLGRSDTFTMSLLRRLERAHAVERTATGRHTRWALPAAAELEPDNNPVLTGKQSPRPPALAKPQEPLASQHEVRGRATVTIAAASGGVSWWVEHAGPDQREAFIDKAHAIDEQRSKDPHWRQPPAVQLQAGYSSTMGRRPKGMLP